MLKRMLVAYGRNVASGEADADDLADLLALVPALDAVIRSTVETLNREREVSWSTIGRAAGITKQSAHARWGPARGAAVAAEVLDGWVPDA